MEKPVSEEGPQTLGHSKWGIFSFLVSLVMIVPGCLIMNNTLPSLKASVFIPLLYCILPIGYLLGVGLAVAGFREKNRKRLFPILGLIINVFASFPMLLMWVLMLMAGYPFVCLKDLTSCLK